MKELQELRKGGLKQSKRDILEFGWDCLNQDIYIIKYSLSQSKVPCLKHRTQKMILGTVFSVFSRLVWLVLF